MLPRSQRRPGCCGALCGCQSGWSFLVIIAGGSNDLHTLAIAMLRMGGWGWPMKEELGELCGLCQLFGPNLAPPEGFSQPRSNLGSCVSDACQLLLVLGEAAGPMRPVFITSVQRNRTVDVEMCKRFIMRNLLMRLCRLASHDPMG